MSKRPASIATTASDADLCLSRRLAEPELFRLALLLAESHPTLARHLCLDGLSKLPAGPEKELWTAKLSPYLEEESGGAMLTA